MPGEDHPAGRRGPSAPYGDRKLWDFFVTHLLDAKTPNWNAVAVPTARPVPGSGSALASLFGESWEAVMAAWERPSR